MKVTNISKGPRGLNTLAGLVILNAGETQDIELSPVEQKTLSKDWWRTGTGAAKGAQQQEDEASGDGEGGNAAAYEVRKGGAGTFSIVDGEGVIVIEKITKKEAEEFADLDDEAKAGWVIKQSAK